MTETTKQTKEGRELENKLIARILLMKKLMARMDAAKLIFYITQEGYGR